MFFCEQSEQDFFPRNPKFLRVFVFCSFLLRRLVPTYKLGFAELCAPTPAQSQPSGSFQNSLSVRAYEKIRTSFRQR
jgi:hypothetical protein